jgi:primase-polymerase (primpol)-like protein
MITRPTTPPPDLDAIPDDLKRVPRWVCWRYEKKDDGWAKMPIDANTGRWASSTKTSTWTAFEIAVDACERLTPRPDGIGIVFSDDDDLIAFIGARKWVTR